MFIFILNSYMVAVTDYLRFVPPGVFDGDADGDDMATEVQTNFVPSQNFNHIFHHKTW